MVFNYQGHPNKIRLYVSADVLSLMNSEYSVMALLGVYSKILDQKN